MSQPEKNQEEKVLQDREETEKTDPHFEPQQDHLLNVGELKWSKEKDSEDSLVSSTNQKVEPDTPLSSNEEKNPQKKQTHLADSKDETDSTKSSNHSATEKASMDQEVTSGEKETAAATLAATPTEEFNKGEEKKDPLENIDHTQTHMPIIEYTLNPTADEAEFSNEKKKSTDLSQGKKLWGIKITARKKKVVKYTWIPALLGFSLIIGFYIGHTVIGKEPFLDLFDLGMWQHLYKLLYG